MTFWVAGAAVVGAGITAYSANKASKAQQQSAAEANAIAKDSKDAELALQEKMFNKNIELQQPTIDAGNTARNRLMQLLGLSTGGDANGSLMKDFSMSDFTADPGYQFRLDQGQQALERSAAARGGLLSGAAIKDATNYAQGAASQEWQAAYDRFNTNRTNKMNPLLSLAGSAQTASGALGAAGQNYANGASATLGNYSTTAGQNITGAGNARASGYVGAANGVTNALGTVVNNYQQNQLLSLLKSKSTGAP
ncbi:hypothetical protein [Massilia aerilata]|uniref:DNA transfer protein n=1 Tax=Massilia aerilata TaxID=453817 RepID=A0ABW0S423_9BURK